MDFLKSHDWLKSVYSSLKNKGGVESPNKKMSELQEILESFYKREKRERVKLIKGTDFVGQYNIEVI